MDLYGVVLFLHILTLLGALGLGATLHTAEWQQKKATTVQELRTITRPFAWGKFFPIFIVLLFVFGAWLLHLSKTQTETFHFSDGWVWTAIVALVILLINGGGILARHSVRYLALLEATPDGPITPEVRAMAFDKTFWTATHLSTFLVIGVVFNMATKPETAVAIMDLGIAILVGVAIGQAGVRSTGANAA